MSDDDDLTVDMYICGQYVGKRKVGRNSIAGLLLTGNYTAAAQSTAKLAEKIQPTTIRLPDRKTTFKHPADAPEADSGPTPDGGPSEARFQAS